MPIRMGIIGASGYIGSRLCELAASSGHMVIPFSRYERPGFRTFSIEQMPDFSGLDAVVNLAGEPIIGYWTADKKRRIQESRIQATSKVVEGLLAESPRILINASAIGYYGDTGEVEADESSPNGTGFLADTCQLWENTALSARKEGVRVICLRIGFVVGPGGAMRFMMPIFRLGLGGNLGNGRQWMSCIHVDDVAGMILWALEMDSIEGPLNAVMPRPVQNIEFTQTLAAAVHRPAIFPLPAFLLRMVMGEQSQVMLDSSRVVPRIALKGGYSFRFATLAEAFQSLGNSKYAASRSAT